MALNRMERAAVVSVVAGICHQRGGEWTVSVLRPWFRRGVPTITFADLPDRALLAICDQWGGVVNPPPGVRAV